MGDYCDISSDSSPVMVNDLPCHQDVDVAIMDEVDLLDGDDDPLDDEEVVDFHDDLVEVLVEVELGIKKVFGNLLFEKKGL